MNLDLLACARLLNSFKSHHQIQQGKQLHLLFLKSGALNGTPTIGNRLLQMYTRCGQMDDARKLFDEMTKRNCFSWNTLLEGYIKQGRTGDLLELFYMMPQKNGFSWDVMISGLAKAGELDIAHGLLKQMPRKNGIVFNSLIHGYVQSGCPNLGLRLFKDYLKWGNQEMAEDFCLDSFVIATSVGACADLRGIDYGKQIHARIIVDGVEFDSVLGSSLVDMYTKCGDLDCAISVFRSLPAQDDFSLSSLILGYANCSRMNDAQKVFDIKTDSCTVLWNSLISGYIANDEVIEALWQFNRMCNEGVTADSSTFASVLSACGSLGILKACRQLHCMTCKLGFIYDLIVASALVDTYAKCGSPNDSHSLFAELKVRDTVLLNSMVTIYSTSGRIEDAKQIFETIPYKSLVSWNSMVVGLSQNGCPIEALDIFCKMNRMNLCLDKFSLASVISACASISSFELGQQVFARSIVLGLDLDLIVSASIIDFYCKCGFVESGRKLFDQTTTCDVVSWNSMLMGYATNGYGIEALHLFDRMRSAGVLPSDITFTGVLSACDHCGMLDEAQKWFCSMQHEYHIDPGIEHYSCMVDLFARAGCLEEALALIEQMPFKADASMWSSILRGCVAHGDRSLGKKVADLVMELDPENSVAFVQLSNIFATSEDWRRSALVRKLMKEKNIQKNPGQSWAAT